MTLGNAVRRETPIVVESHKSYTFGVRILDKDGLPIVSAGAEVRLVVVEPVFWGGNELIVQSASMSPDTPNMFQFRLQAEDLALEPTSYPYSVTLIASTGYSTLLFKGEIEVLGNADTLANNTYNLIKTSSEVTVILDEHDLVQVTLENVNGLPSQVTRPFTVGWIAGR